MEIIRSVSSTHDELFAVLRKLDHGLAVFDLPDKIPERFQHRIQSSSQSRVLVSSLPHVKPVLSNTSSFEQCGIWLCAGDAEPRGGVPELGVAAISSVFGIPLTSRLIAALQTLACDVRVVYHGTGEENFASISLVGLYMTFGQLGTGVYLGSFWKACRFAGRDQDYKRRDSPLVLRVLVRTVSEVLYPRPGHACACVLCEKKSRDRAAACDHSKTWTGGSCGTLLLKRYEDGAWITKNEEWAYARADILRIAEAVRLDKETISGPHYDPLQRDIRIV